MPEKPLTIGAVLRGIRERLGMTFEAMAAHCKVAPAKIPAMEADKAKVMPKMHAAYTSLPLTPEEIESLRRLYHEWSRFKSEITCVDCSLHDGEMRPGGRLGRKEGERWELGDRDELCVNAGRCLAVFTYRYGCTATAHCPKSCTKRDYVERERLVSIGSPSAL